MSPASQLPTRVMIDRTAGRAPVRPGSYERADAGASLPRLLHQLASHHRRRADELRDRRAPVPRRPARWAPVLARPVRWASGPALVLAVLVLAACSPAVQSQPPAAVATVTTAPATSKPAVAAPPPTAKPDTKPTMAAKPAQTPAPVAKAATAPSPTPPGAARANGSPPAIVATSVAGLPVAAPSPAVSAESRAAPRDAIGVATSASSAAAANATDGEATVLCGPGAILSTRAGQAAGRSATIAILKVEAAYQPDVRGQPTFLNDAPYPNHVFTAVIWGRSRAQFQPSPESWQGKALCVTGPVTLFQQRPQIEVTSPSQLRAPR